jgi:hypothetical protein
VAIQTRAILLSKLDEEQRTSVESRIRNEIQWCNDEGSRFDLIPTDKLLPPGGFDRIWDYPSLGELNIERIQWTSGDPPSPSGITLYYRVQQFDTTVPYELTGDHCRSVISFIVVDQTRELIQGTRMPGIAYADFVQDDANIWTHYQFCLDLELAQHAPSRAALYRSMLLQFVLGYKAAEIVRENAERLQLASMESNLDRVAVRFYSRDTPHQARVATNKLRNLLETTPTAAVVSFASAIMIMDRTHAREKYGLSSPYRQAQFLLGILSSTAEPAEPRKLSSEEFKVIGRLLEAVFSAYAAALFVYEKNGRPLTDEEVRYINIAAGPIINHYMAGRLATVEQTKERISEVFRSSEARLLNAIGLRSVDLLRVCDWIVERVLEQATEHSRIRKAYEAAHAKWVSETESLDDWDSMTQIPAYEQAGSAAVEWMRSLDAVNVVSKSALFGAFGELGRTFVERFVTKRGDNPAFGELVERNPARYAPLFAIDEEHIAMPLGNALYDGIFDSLCEVASAQFGDAYARARGKYVERRAHDLFRAFFPSNATMLLNCFQSSELRDEHDLIILHDRTLYIVESKGSPPVNPPPDAARAAIRLEHLFKSTRGIQHGYDQARKVLDLWDAGETIRLYAKDRSLALELVPADIDSAFAIVVTGEDFGILSCDLALLLKKDLDSAYPWAVNLYDLESFLAALNHRAWSVAEFRTFLRQRERLHGHIFATDELDVAGAFLRYGSYDAFPIEPNTKIQMQYGQVFDEIYLAAGGAPVEFGADESPVLLDLRTEIEKMAESGSLPSRGDIAGEDACPCGSTLEFRDCHGAT